MTTTQRNKQTELEAMREKLNAVTDRQAHLLYVLEEIASYTIPRFPGLKGSTVPRWVPASLMVRAQEAVAKAKRELLE